jgi:DNA polymerase V
MKFNTIQLPKIGAIPILIPLFSDKVSAGFPSPADDYMDKMISLDEDLIMHKTATFFVRARGNSMIGAGINEGDMLVVDRSIEPTSGDIVIAAVDGSLTVKRLMKRGSTVTLKPENPRYKEIEFQEGQVLEIWGVVISLTRKFKFRNVK